MTTHGAVERSFRRSRDREALFDEIRARGRARIGELSDATGIRPGRIRAMVRGELPEYSAELSLAGQGLVATSQDAVGELFEVTTAGRAIEM